MPDVPVPPVLPPDDDDTPMLPEPGPLLVRPPPDEGAPAAPQMLSTHTMVLGQSDVDRHVDRHRPPRVQMRPGSQSALVVQGSPQ